MWKGDCEPVTTSDGILSRWGILLGEAAPDSLVGSSVGETKVATLAVTSVAEDEGLLPKDPVSRRTAPGKDPWMLFTKAFT